MLMERQNLFRQAALEAKRSGQMDLAKEYLRSFKQMDPLISANKCGVPVDMNTVLQLLEMLLVLQETLL